MSAAGSTTYFKRTETGVVIHADVRLLADMLPATGLGVTVTCKVGSKSHGDDWLLDFTTPSALVFSDTAALKTLSMPEFNPTDFPAVFRAEIDFTKITNLLKGDSLCVAFQVSGGHPPPPSLEILVEGLLGSIADNVLATADLVESQRGEHTWQGDNWYVAPNIGSDTNDGSRDFPFQTLPVAIAAAGDGTHDVIHLVADLGSGVTEMLVSSTITVNKRYLFIRGLGGDFRIKRTNNGDVINVTANGCELSGFRVETHTTGNGIAVNVSNGVSIVDFVKVRKLQVDHSQGDAICVLNGTNCRIEDNLLRDTGAGGSGHGIVIDGIVTGGSHNHVERNRIYDTLGDGIRVTGANSNHTVIRRNIIDDSTGAGINIVAGSSAHLILNEPANNAGGDILDTGTGTHQHNNDHWATGDDASALKYNGAVHFDDINGVAGAAFGVNGIEGNPTSVEADLLTLFGLSGLRHAKVRAGVLTLTAADWSNTQLEADGEGPQLFPAAATDCAGCDFMNFTVIGVVPTAGGTVNMFGGAVVNATWGGGEIKNAGMFGVLTVSGGGASGLIFTNCYSQATAATPFILDLNSENRQAIFQRWSGDMTLRNQTNATARSFIDMAGGTLTIENTCTGGTVIVTGTPGVIIDNSGAGCTVIDATATSVPPNAAVIADAVWTEVLAPHIATSGSAARAFAIIKGFLLGNYVLDGGFGAAEVARDINLFATGTRLRVFDSQGNVPLAGGLGETTGLLATIDMSGVPHSLSPSLVGFVRSTLTET